MVVQYRRELGKVLWLVGLAVAALPILWLLERLSINRLRFWRVPAGSLLVSVFATCIFVGILANSQYVHALAQLHSSQLQWEVGGLRLASMTLQALELNEMDREIKRLIAEAKRRDGDAAGYRGEMICNAADTTECPDIIYVHLESVFDPALLGEYRGTHGYLDRMEQLSGAPSKSGFLHVHAWGGASWVSEFELLCGVDHRLFGQAGILPHMTLSPYVDPATRTI